jgi:hypothetical protein
MGITWKAPLRDTDTARRIHGSQRQCRVDSSWDRKLLDPVTANLIIDELVNFLGFRIRSIFIPTVAMHVYAPTKDKEGSPLRTLVRDIYVHNAFAGWSSHCKHRGLPYDFLNDVAGEITRLQSWVPEGLLAKIT